MLMVDTELRASAIQGIGVFLREPVSKGQLIWRFDSRIDRIYCEAELASLPGRRRISSAPIRPGTRAWALWVLCGDNGRHFNHSDRPNTLSHGIAFGDDVAARDLRGGRGADFRLSRRSATRCGSNPPRLISRSRAARAPRPRHSRRRRGARRCRAGSACWGSRRGRRARRPRRRACSIVAPVPVTTIVQP